MSSPTEGYGIDFNLIPEYLLKGRMNAIKESLETKIVAAVANATVIDAWRMPTYSFVGFNGPLVSIKINPSKQQKLSYGEAITNNYKGTYYLYHFSLHVLAPYDFSLEETGLESQPCYNYANQIITYLRIHNTDSNKGILDIIQITARESDPAGGPKGGAHMSRVIVEGYILVERPWRVNP
jgi:hypothetical protein